MVGDVAAWTPRLANGKAVLLKRTLDGHQNMPPLGYCMSCEEADFLALIDLMTRGIDTQGAGVAEEGLEQETRLEAGQEIHEERSDALSDSDDDLITEASDE